MFLMNFITEKIMLRPKFSLNSGNSTSWILGQTSPAMLAPHQGRHQQALLLSQCLTCHNQHEQLGRSGGLE